MSTYDHRQLDILIHSRIRLSVMAILSTVEDAEFTYLREQVKTTDGNLGAHLRKLEEAEYLRVAKSFVDRKPISRYRVTPSGKRAFREYLDRLESLLNTPTAEPSRKAAG